MLSDRELFQKAMDSMHLMDDECRNKAKDVIAFMQHQTEEFGRFFDGIGLNEAISIDQAVEIIQEWKNRSDIISESNDDFQTWWWNEGSGISPTQEEVFENDWEAFAKRITEIAWGNGAYKAKEGEENE